ncbi:dipeptide epimerase [Candidatus Velamenicoccus archaeovorus]|nr:dipeptide epimerase [Candidatus Velamenicoccus archaeovorus]
MTMQKGMQIKQHEVLPLRAPLSQPFRTAFGQHDTLDNLLFKIELNNGVVGFGEAAVATHITGETLSQTQNNLKKCGQSLCGRNVADYLSISSALHRQVPDNKAALAAVEMAVFDALARSLKIPLWRFYGERPVKLHTDITIVIDSVENARKKAREFYVRGFRAFKIKIGRDRDQDLERVIAVAKIAKNSKLYLDANQGYSAEQTLKFLKDLETYNIIPDLIEQPVPKNDREGLKKVTRLAKTKVCADESVRDMADAIWAVKEKACDVINIKLMKCGLVQAKEIAFLARANRMGLMVGGMMESSLAMTCSAHIASGLGFIDYVDLDTPFFLKDRHRHKFLSKSGEYDLSKTKSGIDIIP